ncbi:MAG TPA: hypothetical protein VNV41_04495 [Candidatus Acidoferrales bacterium]|jgi:hypothetical protein|nr:hypothetical protein [Candidatus Acidoferrales bacterium]
MRIPVLGTIIDERFLNRRLKSSSLGGIIGCIVAVILFEYRYLVNHIWSWDILSIALTIVGVKMAMMAWYLITD